VLQEAEDPRNPLMERLKFLGIFSSNMDEFFKVRVASMHRLIELGKRRIADVLEVVGEKSQELDDRFQTAYETITEALAEHGVKLLTQEDIDNHHPEMHAWLQEYFQENVLPALVPIILDDNHPFPQLTDGALYFGVKMWGKEPRYAILELPAAVPRFVELPNRNIMYVDDVIRHSLDEIFYIFKYDRIGAYEFKISRDAELDIDNDFSEGYVRKMQKVLRQRKGGRPTRLVHDEEMPSGLLKRLRKELHIGEDDTVIAGGRYHNMKDLMRFPARRLDLSFEELEVVKHPVLDRGRAPMLDTILKGDLMVTYPYQSFDHVIRLLREAAIDPKVEEIKMTVYRAANSSRVVNALINAARNGKKVTVSVELQARFDEEHNIRIAEQLVSEGAHVTYGAPPLKVHSKLMLITRAGVRFAGLSTGNFNEDTSKLYVDSLLLTADKRLTTEVAEAFSFFDQTASMRVLGPPRFRHLLVSPFNSRKTINRLIARETAKKKKGYIFLKINHLTDEKIIARLREAADAGVKTDLIVRTTCAMTPHDNIRAISILDRNLEHQRVYIFGSGPDRVVYMSSADMMERNLDWRVEVAFPIYDPVLQQQVVDMMALQIQDNCKARILDRMQNNQYLPVGEELHRAQYDTHRYLLDLADQKPA
jgi:polyphosphate kinase